MRRLALAILALAIVAPAIAAAHSGGTNAQGCHTNSKTGDHHCHAKKELVKTVAKAEAKTVVKSGFVDKNCEHFATKAQAQAFFIQEGGPSKDPHKLDADKDGLACEALK